MTNPNALSSASPSRQLQNRGPADDVATEPKAVHQAIALAIEFLSIALLTSVMVSMTTARTQGRKLKLIGPVGDYMPSPPPSFERTITLNPKAFFTLELSRQVGGLYSAIELARTVSPGSAEDWQSDDTTSKTDWKMLSSIWQPLNQQVEATLQAINKFDLFFGTDHASRSLEIQHVARCAAHGETPCIRSDDIVLIPGWLDLRKETRIPVGATVWMTTQNWRQRVTLKDLSVAGAGLASCPSLAMGADVKIELPSGVPLHGSVMWSIGGNIGVRFTARLTENDPAYLSVRTLSRRTNRTAS